MAAEGGALADCHTGLDTLRQEATSLEARLREDLRPKLRQAGDAVDDLERAAGRLRVALEDLGRARQEASEKVGQLTKRQLSEIKQLSKSPPDVIRRTLAACWLLLNSDRFQGKPAAAVQFDDAKDWHRCQRMLADDSFVSRVVGFDPGVLVATPAVPLYVAASYLGLGPQAAPMSATQSMPSSPPASPSRGGGRRSMLSAGGASAAALGPRASQRLLPPTPLSAEVVARACEPCGALFRWEHELVAEHVERCRLQAELAAFEAELSGAAARREALERGVGEAEAALARALEDAAARERALEQLRREEAEAKKAARNLQRLDSLMEPGPTPAADSDSAAESPPARRARRPQTPPSVPVEVEVRGTMAAVEHQVARLRVPFLAGQSRVLEGDMEQALVLPKIFAVLKEQLGLKLILEGHCEEGEEHGCDLERSLSVFEWLVLIAGTPPGMLRVKSVGSSAGMGRCVVPVPIHEVVVSKGPLIAELASTVAKPGIYFEDGKIDLGAEARSVIAALATCILEDEHSVRLEGHTATGEPDQVAMKRAIAVRDALLALGVPRPALKAESCKSLYPISRLTLAMNRRVEVHLR